ncbi:uncharacterized protein CANTADRAFT_42282, partial [Suhomyces tanzawaensis NRRL Y-17324]
FFAATSTTPAPSVVPEHLLSPQNCTSPQRIRAFLRLSRIATDDTIREHLNELKGNQACDVYYTNTILPQWNARAQIIQYCSDYAIQLRAQAEGKHPMPEPKPASADDPDPYNLRIDPYAVKNRNAELESRFSQVEEVERWVRNERSVESIVREETAKALSDRCYYRDWLNVYSK